MNNLNKRIKGEKKVSGKNYSELMNIKTKNKRVLCDVPMCNNYAYAELLRINNGWMYVCLKHYLNKINKKTGKPKEKNVGFYILKKEEKY